MTGRTWWSAMPWLVRAAIWLAALFVLIPLLFVVGVVGYAVLAAAAQGSLI